MWPELPADLARSWPGALLLAAAGAALAGDLLLAAAAWVQAERERRQRRLADRLSLFESDLAPPVTVMLHLSGPGEGAVEQVRSLLTLAYPAFEVVVAVDGDGAAARGRLAAAFGLRPVRRAPRARVPRGLVRGLWGASNLPQLLVVELARAGRSRALNAGLAHARHPLVLTLDPGTRLERGTLVALALPFYESRAVIAAGAAVRISERGGDTRRRAFAARCESLETLRETLVHGLGWAAGDSLFVLPAPVALFERDAVIAAGGFRDLAWPEADLVMRLQRRAARRGRRMAVRLVAGAVAWREPSPGAGAATHERRQRGLIEALFHNHALLLDARFALHHGVAFLAQAWTGLLRPAAELAGLALGLALVASGHGHLPFVWMFVAIHGAGGTLVTLAALGLERAACPRLRWPRDYETLALDALLEPFVRRPLVAAARLAGALRALLATPGPRPPSAAHGRRRLPRAA